jgi:glycosyltransferase involved in cell wall biosynthesis
LAPQPALVRIGCATDVPRIVFVGRLVTTKGVGLLLKAGCKLKEQNRAFEIRVIGNGPERAALERQAHESNLAAEVKFLGLLPKERINTYLSDAAVVVVPSIGGEVFGMVVAENMWRGLPVVASDVGAFVEVLGNPDQTFRAGDADDLARQLIRVLESPGLAADWARTGQRRASQSLTERRMVEDHDRVYQRVLCRSIRT